MKRIINMKRTHIRKAASFLAAVLCLAGSVITAGQMPGTVKAAPPRVTFKNEEKAEPYLYVIKDVKSALEGTSVPDNQANVLFTFRLTVEGQAKKNEIFTLYDSKPGDGRQGVSVEADQVTPEDAEINGPWQITRNGVAYTRQQKSNSQTLFATDDDGEFTLQAGQMARFYIGRNKSYEVTEVSMPDRFTADADNTSGTDGIMGKSGRYAVITNKWLPDEQPGETTRLEVKKTVVFPDRYQPPESLFAFQLAVFGQNGYEAYAGQAYTVMEANQETPVVIQGVTNEQGRAVTDADGVFYLKAGTRAVFQEFPAKGYWVKELLEADDIESIGSPAVAGSAQAGSGMNVQADTTGQIQGNNGDLTTDGSQGNTGDLTIDENQGNTGDPMTDESQGNGGNLTTDENQENGGPAAPDASFRTAALTALENGFWRLANGTEQKQERVASAPLALNTFENINAAFMVTKSIRPVAGQDSGEYADKEFTFLLTRGDERAVWPRACYWLYDAATCRPILENGTPVTGQTDDEGKFRLKPGQSAVFYSFYETVSQNGGDDTEGQSDGGQTQSLRQSGIASGTTYGVTEEPATGFRQYTPGTLDYYTGLEVDDSVKPCSFVNEVKEPGGLSVTKQVVNAKGEAPLDKDDVYFKFVLKKKKAGVTETSGNTVNPENYEAAANVLYSVTVGGTIIRSGRTDENGYFILKANETADFDKILRGDFYVQEVDSALSPGYWFDHVEWSGGSENQTSAESRIGTGTTGMLFSGDEKNAGGRLAGAMLTAASDIQYGTDMTAVSSITSVAGTNSVNDPYDVEDSAGSSVIGTIPGISAKNSWTVNNPLPFTLTADGMDITYYNKYTPDRTDLTLVKMNNETNGSGLNEDGTPGETYTGEGEHLANAEFDLYRVERQTVPDGEDGEKIEETETLMGHYVTTVDGLSIPDLASGVYRLKETKAPDGYMPMDTIEIEVERLTRSRANGNSQIAAGTVIVTINGTTVPTGSTPGGVDNNRKASDRKPCAAGLVSNALAAAGNPGYANDDQLTVWAYDEFLYALPHSGGSGIYWYLIGGVLLMMAASLILYKDKTKYAGRC